jgi:hypothetical protein
MIKIKKSDIGSYLAVRILDHTIKLGAAIDEPAEIEVIGIVTSVNNKSITLASWVPITSDPMIRSTNSERSVILQSCIVKVINLYPGANV